MGKIKELYYYELCAEEIENGTSDKDEIIDELKNLVGEAQEEIIKLKYPEFKEDEKPYQVTFRNERGQEVTSGFWSPYLAKQFVRKLNHSKRCRLISYSGFDLSA